MKIGITGTPGTGKSSVSRHLEGKIIDLKQYLDEKGIGNKNQLGEIEVGIDELRRNSPVEPEEKDLIVEGHLSHFLDLDFCIILRCRPDKLETRLEKRDYPREKVEENLESEKLDLILSQAIRNQETVFEIDTTEKGIMEAAEEVEQAIKQGKENYGQVDWSDFI